MQALYYTPNVYHRRRMTLLVILVMLGFLGFQLAGHMPGSQKPATTVVTVGQGETLWGIAESLHLNRDVRDWIYDVVQMNHLKDSVLMPGMQLKVPVK